MSWRWYFVSLLLVLLPLSVAADLLNSTANGPIGLEADSLEFDQASGRYHAMGNVSLKRGELHLSGEQLWWNQVTGEIEAEGQILLRSPGEELSGRRLKYNLNTGSGVLEEGEAYWRSQSLRLTGKRLERFGPEHFRLLEGRVTLCDGETPAWSIGSSRADVTIGRYLTARNVWLYAKNVPFFYSPYLIVPIKNQRESGFLLPSFGVSKKRGVQFSTAWYQVLGRNMDATLSLDRLSTLGTGLGLEYRYIFGRKQRGQFKSYTILGRDNKQRWLGNWQHFGQIRDHLRLVVDAEYVNTRDYFVDYGQIAADYNEQKVISSVFLSQNWSKVSLTGQYKAIKDLESADSPPWQASPLIDLSIVPLRIKSTPLYADLHTSFIRFERKQGVTGQRLMLRPRLGVHRYLARGISLNAELGYRQKYYSGLTDIRAMSEGSTDVSGRLAGRLFRVYGSGERHWLHQIEPEVNYRRIAENHPDAAIDFDRYDQIDAAHTLGYALVNRLTGQWRDGEGQQQNREVLWLKLSQNYRLTDVAADETRFSTLRTELVLRPTVHNSLNLNSYYDFSRHQLSYLSLGGRAEDGRGNAFSLTYLRQRTAVESADLSNVNFHLETSLLKPLFLAYDQRYDLQDSTQLEEIFGLELREQCWGIRASYTKRQDDEALLLTLTLSGLGSVGSYSRGEISP